MPKKCFVIMPFSWTSDKHDENYWTDFFDSFITPIVNKLGYECLRSSAKPRQIITDILEELTNADLVLAVITDKNPNVWYELGIRHATRRGTIMMIEKGQEIPFDVRSFGIIHYTDSFVGLGDFETKLREAIYHLENTVEFDSPVKHFFSNRHVKPCWVAEGVQYTPFNLFADALITAQERIVIVGQNLHSLTLPKWKFKEILFNELSKRTLRVELLICEDDEPIVKLMSAIGDGYHRFYDDLLEATTIFKQWQQDTIDQKLPGTLILKFSQKIGNISATIIDPDHDTGKMLLTPVLDDRPRFRSCFWITKKDHGEIFDNYMSFYEVLLR